MSNLLLRTITGISFGSLMVLGIWAGSYYSAVLFAIISSLSLYEFYRLVSKKASPQALLGVFAGSLIYILFALSFLNFIHLADVAACSLLLMFPFVSLIVELFRKKERPFFNVAITFLGLFYIVIPFVLLSAYENLTGSTLVLLGFFCLVWSNDTFAYFSGRLFGKHKLFERISPKKTWEGSIGGLIFSLLTAYLFSMFTHTLTLHQWLIISVIVAVFGTLGDLVESLLKRSLDVKDSGTILPGHGGILDRFDGAIVAAPFVFAYLYVC